MKFAKILLTHGLFLTQKNAYNKAEIHLSKAITIIDACKNSLDFMMVKIEIAQVNLKIDFFFNYFIRKVISLCYLRLKEFEKGYQILFKIYENLNLKVLPNHNDFYLCGIDQLVLDLSKFAYKIGKYDEAKARLVHFIGLINNLVGNVFLLKILRDKYLKSPIIYEQFIDKKILLLAYMHYLMSKLDEKMKNDNDALHNVVEAIRIANKINEPPQKIIKTFANFADQLRKKREFEREKVIKLRLYIINMNKVSNFSDFENSLPNHNKILADLPEKPEKTSRKEKILRKVLIYNDIRKEKIEKNRTEDELKKKSSSNKSNKGFAANLSAEKNQKILTNKQIIFKRSFNHCNFSNSNTFSFVRPKTSSAHKSSISIETFKNSNFSNETYYTSKLELIERPKKTENKTNCLFSKNKKCYSLKFIK